MYDICVIGGGPAGMSAAITAKRQNPRISVCIIEKNQNLGKKIYATGNGKCNLSNTACQDSLEVLKFFDHVGIFTRVDEAGRMYPASEQAADVVIALENALVANKVDIVLGEMAHAIIKTEQGFEIQLPRRTISTKKLLLATGGKAGPQYGNLGEGYSYAKQFGHHVNRTYPVLAPLECEGNFMQLKGIRSKGKVSLLKNAQIVASESGEIQFTEDGLSGICVFNLSRFVRLDSNLSPKDAIKSYKATIDFIPSLNQQDTEILIKHKMEIPGNKAEDLLLTVVHPGISKDILKKAGIPLDAEASAMTRESCQQLATLLKHWDCEVLGVKGWKKAQCTGGGIPLDEVDTNTGASIIVEGLYFAGELLDYDGPSGGFNLHFAWDSGTKAGKAMSNEII